MGVKTIGEQRVEAFYAALKDWEHLNNEQLAHARFILRFAIHRREMVMSTDPLAIYYLSEDLAWIRAPYLWYDEFATQRNRLVQALKSLNLVWYLHEARSRLTDWIKTIPLSAENSFEKWWASFFENFMVIGIGAVRPNDVAYSSELKDIIKMMFAICQQNGVAAK